ncbi:putative disease resistance protein RGA3, partial [Oryza sativa Japonica Group]
NATESQGTNIRESSLDQLHKSIQDKLKSKRFLIVFDDIWEHDFSKAASTKRFSKTEWEKLLAPFGPGETNGNMVLVTTRFPKVAETVKKGANQVDLHGLEPDEFWDFFQLCAFSETQDDNDKEKLFDIGKQIAKKLKCSPLAAKTVGPLLRKKPTRKHWMEILEKEEWLKQKDGDDSIITALKISYDYLPFYLKKCFSYLALFPEDYEFDSLEISCYWDSIGIINSSGKNDTIEGIGSQYLNELYDNGFLMKGDDNHYVMHDLLHELSQIVSSRECANINYSSFRADDILPSIRHLSITIQDKYTESFKEEMEKIKKRVDIRNLRSVMIFGSYRSRRIANVVRDTLNEIRALRVLFIFMNSPHSLPDNFSKLVHLRYLKIGSPWGFKVCIPSTVSKLYHLKFLDLKSWGGSNNNLPNDFNRLINLRHFLAKKEFHSNVPEVGKMKCLQELKEFHVKKDKIGFELAQLGQLEQLRGELCIFGLKNATREEAIEAKLKHKSNLSKLRLDRGGNREKNTSSSSSRTQVVSNENQDDDIILDSLQPHSNLTELSIVNLGGGMAPSWLGSNIIHLDTLHLDGVPWATLAPFGKIQYLRELKLRNIVGMYHTH